MSTKSAQSPLGLFGTDALIPEDDRAIRDTVRPEQISLGTPNTVREAIAVARQCRTLLGAAGITLDYPGMRHADSLESVLTDEGTCEIHQLVIGQALTGHGAFR